MNLERVLEVLGILVPLAHFAGFAFAAHAALFGRTSQGAVAWALSLIFFPYLAIPLYVVFGRRRFHGYVEARRLGISRIDHLGQNLVDALKPAYAHLCGRDQRFDVFQHLTLIPFTTGNTARVLVDGRATFDGLFAAIDNAQSYLLIQFFIVRDDALGRDLADRLIRRARAGVRIHFIYDEIGSRNLGNRYLARLRAAGVHIRAFNSRRGWRNRFQINFRNHRKILVADGLVAFVGGHNVGVEYLGQGPLGPWRDTHVEVHGPVVAGIIWTFLEDWHWAAGEILDIPLPPPLSPSLAPSPDAAAPPADAAASPADAAAAPPDAAHAQPAAGNAIVIASGPADELPICTLMLLAAISSARQRLWITSPYFVPDETVFDALQLAAIRGVDVRIILPNKPDHILVYLSSFSYLDSAEEAGVKFYRYRAGFLHQKVILVDADLAAVGTANLDNRSMRLNFEITVLFADRTFAAQVSAMLESDFTHCERATPGDLRRRKLPFRLAVRIARLLSPVQ